MKEIETKKWIIENFDQEKIKIISKKLNISELEYQILESKNFNKKNIETYKLFLKPPESFLFDTNKLSSPIELNAALNRIKKAINDKERILIHGDADADGICGTSILVTSLRQLGLNISFDFPIRAIEGHGIQVRIIEKAKKYDLFIVEDY